MLHDAAGSSACNSPSQSIPSGDGAGATVAAPEQQCWPLVAALALRSAVSPAPSSRLGRAAGGTGARSTQHPLKRSRDGDIALPLVPVPTRWCWGLTD